MSLGIGIGPSSAAPGSPPPVGAKLEKCLKRFDRVAEEPSPAWDDWRERGGLRIWRRVSEAIDDRFGHNVNSKLTKGFIDALFDSPRDRIVVVVDPRRVDLAEVERDLDRVAQRVQDRRAVKGGRVHVQVYRGCFPAADILRMRREVRRDFQELGVQSLSGPSLDSRTEVGVRPGDARARRILERRYGLLVRVVHREIAVTAAG